MSLVKPAAWDFNPSAVQRADRKWWLSGDLKHCFPFWKPFELSANGAIEDLLWGDKRHLDITTYLGTQTWVETDRGLALESVPGAENSFTFAGGELLDWTSSYTIEILWQTNGFGVENAQYLMEFDVASFSGNKYMVIQSTIGSYNGLNFGWYDGGVGARCMTDGLNGSDLLLAPLWGHMFLRFHGGSMTDLANHSVNYNGASFPVTTPGGWVGGASANKFFSHDPNRTFDGVVSLVNLWQRDLTDLECEERVVNPFGFLRRESQRTASVVPVAPVAIFLGSSIAPPLDRRIKPATAFPRLNKTLVDPRFQHLWDDLHLAVLFNRRGGQPEDIIGRYTGVNNAGAGNQAWVASPYGPAWNNADANYSLEFGPSDGGGVPGRQADPHSMFFFGKNDAVTGPTYQILGPCRNTWGGNAPLYPIIVGGNQFHNWNKESAQLPVSIHNDGKYHTYGYSHAANAVQGEGVFCFDGTILSTVSSGGTWQEQSVPWRFGFPTNSSTWMGDVVLMLLWGRALDVAELQLLAIDPFGLVRPIRHRLFGVPAAVDGTSVSQTFLGGYEFLIEVKQTA